MVILSLQLLLSAVFRTRGSPISMCNNIWLCLTVHWLQEQQSLYPWCPSRQPKDFTSALCHQPLAHTQVRVPFWEILNNPSKNALHHQNDSTSPMHVTQCPKTQQKMCKSLLNLSFNSDGLKMRLCSRMLPCMFSPFSLSCINACDTCQHCPTCTGSM